MALFYECMLKCAQKLLDSADIVREAMFRQLACCAAGSVVDRLISQLMNLSLQRQIAGRMQLGHEYDDHLLLRIDPKCGVEEPAPVV